MPPGRSTRVPRRIRKLLVANRSEIAIRVFRAATELGLRTVAIYSLEDRFALHRFKADEAYQVGKGDEPVRAYLGIEEIVRTARACGADAIHPGYGFLAENPELADACVREGIVWIGPPRMVMERLGNKVEARAMAERAGVPVMPATGALPDDPAAARRLAEEVGFPLMVKASWGGGGRGMRMVHDPAELDEAVETGRREARAAFGNDEVFLERLVERAWHIEVQILADRQGNVVHLLERDCTVQRRHQKVVEIAPSPRLDPAVRDAICDSAVRLMREARYQCAGTVEFLMDADTGDFFFIEVNPRIQVEHTVTEVVTGIDIVKAQIAISQGAEIGTPESGVPPQGEIAARGSAMQCRITTEDPENHFIPDYGRISAYREATGFGIRLDGGTAYSSAVITPVLRLAAGEGDRVGAQPRGVHPAHGAGAARVPHPGREDQPPLPGGAHHPPVVPGRRLHHPLRGRHPRALPLPPAPRPRDAAALVHGRRPREREPRGRGPAGAHPHAGSPDPRGGAAARGAHREPRPAAGARARRVRLVDARAGAPARDRHHLPRRPPVAAGHALPHARPAGDPPPTTPATCPACCRWRPGAGPPSTWRCGS